MSDYISLYNETNINANNLKLRFKIQLINKFFYQFSQNSFFNTCNICNYIFISLYEIIRSDLKKISHKILLI